LLSVSIHLGIGISEASLAIAQIGYLTRRMDEWCSLKN
jgi:hypothetical protein